MKIIDVSEHQGVIDWKKVKSSGVEGVIVRMGYGWGANEDSWADRHIRGCEEVGLPYGIYYYSYATNMGQAKVEVAAFLNFVKNYNPTLPIVMDTEDADGWRGRSGLNSWQTVADILVYELEQIERAGYYAMYYLCTSWYKAIRPLKQELDKYDLWLAHWGVDSPPIPCGIWQYSSTGWVPGVSTNVDVNIAYKDYPIIIADMGKNKTIKTVIPVKPKEASHPTKKTNAQIANEIMNGVNGVNPWGDGEHRYIKLTRAGYDYNAIMDIVNKAYGYSTVNINVGDLITIVGSTYATGEAIPDWVKAQKHIVSEISNDQVLVGYPRGICSWVYLKDVRK